MRTALHGGGGARAGLKKNPGPAGQRKRQMEAVPTKTPRLDQNGDSNSSMAASKTRVVLALCGSFSPITNSHMRLLGMHKMHSHSW